MSAFLTKILLATDGSEDAVLAARAAVDISDKAGAELHVVHAWRAEFSKVSIATVASTPAGWYEWQAEKLLAEQVEQIEGLGGTVAEAHLVRGDAAERISELAGELDAGLVVLGSRGLGTVKRLLVGSVSEGVIREASCPVLVVRGGEDAWPPVRVVVGEDFSEESVGAAELAAQASGSCSRPKHCWCTPTRFWGWDTERGPTASPRQARGCLLSARRWKSCRASSG